MKQQLADRSDGSRRPSSSGSTVKAAVQRQGRQRGATRRESTRWHPIGVACSALSLSVVVFVPSRASANNPIVQTSYTADPAPMVHEGTLFVYTSHDEDVTENDFYTMNDWHLYSTEDMVNWTDHGSPAGLHTFSWSTDSAWAPQGIARNGQYYLYVPLNNNTGARIGVGVSDNLAGPFTDPLGKELAMTGSGDIDPTVFIDTDGQAHMYWGNETLRYVELNEDMISTSGTPVTVPLDGFTEGPWFYRRESLYYLLYASLDGGTEKISYATSESPTGPWNIRGDVMASGTTYTNHAGVVDYQGHSYFFYHNSALPGGNDFKRSVCVEEFSYGADGSIPELTMSTEGPAAIDTLNPFEQVEAETIAFSSGLKTEECDDVGSGMNVTAISDGDYILVKNVDFLNGVTSFEARVASSANNATLELRLDSPTGTPLGSCDVAGAASWTTTTCAVSGGNGTHDLYLTFHGDGDDLFKFNWWKFSGPTPPDDGGEGGAGGETSAGGSAGLDAGAGGEHISTAGGKGDMPATGGKGDMTTTGGAGAATGGLPNTGGANSDGGMVSDLGGTGGADTSEAGASPANAGSEGTPLSGSPGSGGEMPVSAPVKSDADAGCSCRVSASVRGSGGLAALWLLASLVFLRRGTARIGPRVRDSLPASLTSRPNAG